MFGTMKTATAVRLVLVVLLTTLAVVLAGWLLYRLQAILVWTTSRSFWQSGSVLPSTG